MPVWWTDLSLFCRNPKRKKRHYCYVSILLVWFRFVGLISFQFPPWKYWQMTLLFSYPERFHVFGGSSPRWIKTNFLSGLGRAFSWGTALESVRYDWGTFRMFLLLYSFLLLDVYLCTTFCGKSTGILWRIFSCDSGFFSPEMSMKQSIWKRARWRWVFFCIKFHTWDEHQHVGRLICMNVWHQLQTEN